MPRSRQSLEYPRTAVTTRLTLDAGDVERSLALVDALKFGLDLLLEDERRLIAEDRPEEIAFGAWLTLRSHRDELVYDVLSKRLPQVVRGLIAMRLVNGFTPHGQFSTVQSIAAAAGLPRGKTFMGWAPRARLLAPLVQAYLSTRTGQPRLAALTCYSHLDLTSPESKAYGVQRMHGTSHSVLRYSGVAGLGPDVVVPHAIQPEMIGMPSDPAQLEAGAQIRETFEEELARAGHSLPGDHADLLEQTLKASCEARCVLKRAAKLGSRVCGDFGIAPADALERAFPPWLASGSLESGVSDEPPFASARCVMPGTRAAQILTARALDLQPLYRLFDSAEGQDFSHLADLVFSPSGMLYSGPQFARILLSRERFERIPSLNEVSSAVLDGLGASREGKELGVRIDSAHVSYLWRRQGLILADGDGGGMVLSLVLRTEQTRHIAWVTTADLSDPRVLADTVARCDLHFRSENNVTHTLCVPRVLGDFGLHRLTPHRHDTRTWMQHACLIASQLTVEAARRRQADR